MKDKLFMLCLLLLSLSANAQKEERIKGSKVVTLNAIEVDQFDSVEVGDNLEIFLIKADRPSIEIEADDNLHDAIQYDVNAGTLLLSSSKNVTSSKKFSVKVYYNDNLRLITARDEAHVTATTDLILNEVTFKLLNAAKIYATVKTTTFTLIANDKTKAELNLTAENTTVELSKNANVKGLIASSKMTFDLYQKASAVIEGDVLDLKLRLDNNAVFTGKNLAAASAEITAEGYTQCTLTVNTKAVIDAAGEAVINLTGEPKIELRRFTGSALLAKKPVK